MMVQSLDDFQPALATSEPLFLHEELLRVQDVMTPAPITVTPSTSVHEARRRMQQCRIRHLPVLADERLVGIVSDRDVRTVLPSPATSLSVREIHYLLDQLTVGEIMTRFVMTVAPETPLVTAIGRMLGHQIGALMVVVDGEIAGILTRTDGLRACVRLLATASEAGGQRYAS